MIFFTSDPHFFHKNIIEYCKRPYRSVEHMNEELILNWNRVVQPHDTVYVLGDVVFGGSDKMRILDELNGFKHLIVGNHDNEDALAMHFIDTQPYKEIKAANGSHQRIMLLHYPMETWNGAFHGSWHLHGHSHGALHEKDTLLGTKRLDVGVDVHNYTPISMDEVADIMRERSGRARVNQ